MRRRGHPPVNGGLVAVLLLWRGDCGILPTAIPPQRASTALRRLQTSRKMIKIGGRGTHSLGVPSKLTRKWHVTHGPSSQASSGSSPMQPRTAASQDLRASKARAQTRHRRQARAARPLACPQVMHKCQSPLPAVTSVNFDSQHRQWGL
jgi:hypothetical protein